MMARFSYILMLLVVMATGGEGVKKSNILLLTGTFKSQLHMLASACEGLPSRGHVLYAAVPTSSKILKSMKKDWNIKPLIYQHPEGIIDLYSKDFSQNLVQSALDRNRTLRRKQSEEVSEDQLKYCDAAMSDQNFLKEVENLNISLAIIDGIPLANCWGILPYKLGIPFIDYFNLPKPWVTGTPMMASFVPAMTLAFTEKMSFVQRLVNCYTSVKLNVFPMYSLQNTSMLQRHLPDSTIKDWHDLASQAAMFIISSDPVLAYPEPTMPNVQYIGAVTPRPAVSVAQDIEDFMKAFDKGIILVSFGSSVNALAERVQLILLDALRNLTDHGIVIKAENNSKFQGKNILTLPWFQQNDLLGHEKVRVFVSHGGSNSLHESVYHGIPIVVIPIFAEQPYNAALVEYKGYGRVLDLNTLTSYALAEAVRQVLEDGSYTDKVRQASRIMKRRPMNATESMIYWVEHLLQFGGNHLRSYALNLPWYQYWMVDIFSMLFTVVFLVTIVLCLIFNLIINSWNLAKRMTN